MDRVVVAEWNIVHCYSQCLDLDDSFDECLGSYWKDFELLPLAKAGRELPFRIQLFAVDIFVVENDSCLDGLKLYSEHQSRQNLHEHQHRNLLLGYPGPLVRKKWSYKKEK